MGAMKSLPVDVIKVNKVLLCYPSDKRNAVAQKLIADSPELVNMWQTLEKRNSHNDDLWVWAFLETARDASALPPYHYKSLKDRTDLSARIATLATNLVRALKANDLDGHLIRSDGKIFNGFFLYEDFSESNQWRIDNDGTDKLEVTLLIDRIAERAKQKIDDEPMPGKVGGNVKAIRFVRIVAKRNQRWYGETLNTVVATATNAMFGASYTASDISNLLSRQ